MAENFPGRTLHTVQAFRGIAALLVVLFHTTQFISIHYEVVPCFGFFYFGFAGVFLFFVLSGFIIYFIHHNDVGRPLRVFHFVKKRSIRIYPTYWIILGMCAVSPWLNGKLEVTGLLHNVALMGTMPQRLVVPTAWTLWYEMIFYLFFGLVILVGRAGFILLILWFVGVGLVSPLALDTGFPLLASPFNALFVLGVAVAALTLRISGWKHRNRVAKVTVMLGAFIFAPLALYSSVQMSIGGIVAWQTWPYVFGFGLASACLMVSPSWDDCEEFFRKRKWLLVLGDASYSIYLIHYPLVRLIIIGMRKFNPFWGIKNELLADVWFVIIAGVVIAAGCLFYHVIERPTLAILRGRREKAA